MTFNDIFKSSFLENVTSPFTTTRTTRKVGLGIPLMKAGCEGAEGQFVARGRSVPAAGRKPAEGDSAR